MGREVNHKLILTPARLVSFRMMLRFSVTKQPLGSVIGQNIFEIMKLYLIFFEIQKFGYEIGCCCDCINLKRKIQPRFYCKMIFKFNQSTFWKEILQKNLLQC